jgi:hypothetical protein
MPRVPQGRLAAGAVLVLVSGLALAGCQSLGPKMVRNDRIDYGASITESWKRQALLNIVKLRYLDPPIFVDVGQIVSGYSLETAINLGFADSNGSVATNTLSLGGAGRFIDRPTITYLPLTGSRFVNSLVTPISPASLFSAIQAGWPADTILRSGVGAINGITNDQAVGSTRAAADPNFERVAVLMRELQLSGDLSIRVERREDGTATLFTIRRGDRDGPTTDPVVELRGLLGLDPGISEFSLAYGSLATNGAEIAVQSRSLFNVLQLMAAQADVPPDDLRDGRATPGMSSASSTSLPGFAIRFAADRPDRDYVSVKYRDTWFYIDDTDLTSKRVFALIMLLFTLADTTPDAAQPVITIPAQ